jgi:hypothetical protein
MALPKNKGTREYDKFQENAGGDVAVRVITTSGGLPSSWGIVDGRKVVTTAGTAVAIVASSTAFNTLTIQAEENNTGDIMIGASTVVEAPDSDRGIRLPPGVSYHFAVDGDLGDLYIDSAQNGDGVVYFYTT